MEEEDNMYNNLLVILKLFQNRPHHLSKFLIENDALNSDFLDKIADSDKLSDISKNGLKDNNLHFNNLTEMRKYYTSLIDDLENLRRRKSKEELSNDINEKLQNAILKENFEDACRIRDFMKRNNIDKI